MIRFKAIVPGRRVTSLTLAVAATLVLVAPVIAQDELRAPKPFIWPSTGRITQPYGCTGFYAEPRYGSCRHFHGGFDIADKEGTPIHAAADGVITHVGWDDWGTRSWMVIINHDGALTTWYAHLRGRQLQGIDEGVRVRQGQVIGYMSDTGMATGVHLHWAVLKDGRYVDPRKYVDGRPFKPRKVGRPTNPVSCDDIWIAAAPATAGRDGAGGATAMVVPGDGWAGGDVTCPA